MALKDDLKTWDDFTRTEDYKGLPASDREILSRKFMAQRVGKNAEYQALDGAGKNAVIARVRGIDTKAPAGPSAGETFGREAKKAFGSTLTGAAINRAQGEPAPAPDEGYGFLDSFGGLAQNLQGGGLAGAGQGAAAALGAMAGTLADPAGLAVDLGTAGVGSKVLRGATAARRALATGAASGAIQAGGVAGLQGGGAGQVAQAGLMGAALGAGASSVMSRQARPAAPPPAPTPQPVPRPPLALPPAPDRLALPAPGQTVRRKTPAVTPPGLRPQEPVPAMNPGYSLDELLEMQQQLRSVEAPPGDWFPTAPQPPASAPTFKAPIPRTGAVAPLPPGGATTGLPPNRRVLTPHPDEPPALGGADAWGDIYDPKSRPQEDASFLGRLFSDETGSATVEAPFAIPAAAGAVAGRALRRGNELLDRGLSEVAALPGRGVAALTNAASRASGGGDVLRSGYDHATGEDRFGAQVAEAVSEWVATAKPGNPYAARVLEAVRGYVLPEHNLPAGYKTARETRATQGRLIAQEGVSIRERLDKDLTPEQQVELYRVLNDRDLTDTSLSGVSEPVRQRITELSRELVEVGSITPKAFEVHQDQYLRRLYEKYYLQQPAAARWLKNFARDVKGSMARGKERELAPKTAALFNRAWETVSETGGKVTIKDAATGETRTVTRQNLGNYLGTWREVGRGKGGKAKYRRDWTEMERETMGEIRQAPVAIEETFKQAAADLANGRLLKDVASNPEWSLPAQAVRDGRVEVPEGWVLIEDARAGLTGTQGGKTTNKSGLPRWGALAGHYVEPNIARDLVMAQRARERSNLDALMGWWKKSKTVYNLKSHVNNFAQNLVALELNGASAFDLPEAFAMVRAGGDEFKQLEAAGLFDNSFAATEFAKQMEGTTIGNPWNLVQQGAQKMAAMDRVLTNAYQGADDVFRAAYALRRMREGLPVEQAVKQARERFYNGTINSPFIQDASKSVLPFIRPAAWGAAQVPQMVLRNPAKVAKLAALYMGWNELSKAMTGDTSERVEGREAMLPDYQRPTLGVVPKVAQMPMRDTKGQPLIADVQSWSPANVFEPSERSPFGVLPNALMPSGPYVNAVELASNIDLFRGQPITSDAKTIPDQAADYLDFAARAALPSTLASDIGIPGVTRGKLLQAAQGLPDYGGRHYDVPTAAANLLVKVQPFNERLAFEKMGKRLDRELAEIQGVVGLASRALESGVITPERYREIVEAYGAVYRAKLDQVSQRTQKAQKALGGAP